MEVNVEDETDGADDSPWRECPGCRPWGEPTGGRAGFLPWRRRESRGDQHDGHRPNAELVFLGVEAAWVNFGKFDGVITSAAGSTRVGYDPKTGTAALTGRIPVGDLVTLYAKAGYMYWSTDVTLTGTVTDPHFVAGTDHGHDPFYGAGLRFNFGKFSVLGEWERYKLRDVDINAVSAGVRVTL